MSFPSGDIPDADLGFNIGKRLLPRGFIGTTAYYVRKVSLYRIH